MQTTVTAYNFYAPITTNQYLNEVMKSIQDNENGTAKLRKAIYQLYMEHYQLKDK